MTAHSTVRRPRNHSTFRETRTESRRNECSGGGFWVEGGVFRFRIGPEPLRKGKTPLRKGKKPIGIGLEPLRKGKTPIAIGLEPNPIGLGPNAFLFLGVLGVESSPLLRRSAFICGGSPYPQMTQM